MKSSRLAFVLPMLLLGLLALTWFIIASPTRAASGEKTSWTVYDYNPSGHALAPRVAASSHPATMTSGTWSFPFEQNTYTALLTTTDPSLTGDLTSKTLTDSIAVSGVTVTGTFQEQNGGGCTPDKQYVRFYFTSPTGAGASGTTGRGSAGFYTQFWWSNPVHYDLTGNGAVTLTAPVSDPTQWSDWNGHKANYNSDVTASFNRAVTKVQEIGLSFGGGCFFENGVTTSDGSGIFSSTFSET